MSNKLVQLILVALIAVIYINTPIAVIQNDLDSAARWASDHFFKLGSPNLLLNPHTNGPLFFLKFPTPYGNSILLSVLFDVATKFVLGWYLLLLSKHFRHNNYWLPLILFISFCTFLSLDFIIISIVLATCLLILNSSHKLYLPVFGLAILTFSIYIKASISFPSLIIFASTILLLIWKKDYSKAVIISSIFMTLFVIITFLIYGFNFNGFYWLSNSFIKTLSFGNDQAIYFNNSFILLLVTVLFILAPAFLIRNKQSKELFLITFLAIFSFWKYCNGREDFGHYQAWYLLCIMLAGFIVIINNKQAALIGTSCYFLSFSFFVSNTESGDSPKQTVYNKPHIKYLPRIIFKYEIIKNEYLKKSKNYLDRMVLSDRILSTIGNKTVDVFPWGLAVFSKYDLNYRPRPNFHSTLLGPAADQSDADHFYNKDQAPEFILWHDSQPYQYNLNAHDRIYLPNATPKAILAIKNNYKLLKYENGYALWQKTETRSINPKRTTQNQKIKLKEWFTAPAFDSLHTFFVTTNFQLSNTDELRNLLYKGRFFKIHYKLKNGNIAIHFLASSSLQNNFLAQPYFTNPALNYQPVEQIMIEAMHSSLDNMELVLSIEPSTITPL